MTDIILTLKPVLDIFFGIGAVVMFAELLIVFRRATTYNFSAGRIVELVVSSTIFVICLDWVAGFYFFKDVVAPLVWSLLNGSG
nr:hypothetical protein [Candidatus Njordarchaeota archaeon]